MATDPATGDVPEHLKIALWHEPNPEDNAFGSKAVGEPPFMLAISVWEVLRDAVASTKAKGDLVKTRPCTAGPHDPEAPKSVKSLTVLD